MQKKSLTALLLSSVSFIGMALLISCVTNTKSHTYVPELSVNDTPFVQETHTAFPVGNDKQANEIRGIAVDHGQKGEYSTND